MPILTDMLKLMRPKQWIKNSFVLAPLLFSDHFMQVDETVNALLATFLFCVASAAVYIINDYHDIAYDRRHPVKSLHRPTSGHVPIVYASVLLVVLLGILAWGYFQQAQVTLVIVGYLVLNIAYTYVLKNQPVVDLFSIAIGSVLRVYAGSVAISVPLSSWMFVTTLCLALYLGSIQRRQELRYQGDVARNVFARYSTSLMNRYGEISTTGALLFYSLFVMTERPNLIVTVPLVIFGLFRSWFLMESSDIGESSIDILTSDWQLILTVVAWIAVCLWSLWLG
jgi:decaprenyl-phosphate phosphoribosyltransferase